MKISLLSIVALCAIATAAFADPAPINQTGRGTQIGTRPDQGVSFYGSDPITQPSGTAQAALSGSSIKQFVVTGHNGAGSVTLTGAPLGATVISVVNLTTPGDATSSFESTISVAGQIQQSSATDLSAKTLLVTIDNGSGKTLVNALRSALVNLGLIKGSN